MPDKLLIPPDQASYSFEEFSPVLAAKLDGGASRTRLDVIGGDPSVNVQWTLSRENFQALVDFYRTSANLGADSFFLDLYLEAAELAEYECHFIPGSFKLSSQTAHRFVVTATLEVKPSGRDQEYEQAIVMIFEEYGSVKEADEAFQVLEDLVNVDMAIGDYPLTIEEADTMATLLVEYGGAETLSETLTELETLIVGMPVPDQDNDFDYNDNLAILTAEYAGAEPLDETLAEFETLFAVMVDDYQDELSDGLAPLLEEYPCCSEATVDATLQELETLIGNLPMADNPFSVEESQELANIILAYGDPATTDDAIGRLRVLVNYELPEATGP